MKLAFLVYVSRSGSTLLARLLADRLAATIVMPEIRLPELLLLYGEDRLSGLSAQQLLAVMQQDQQLQLLEFHDTSLAQVCDDAAGQGSLGILLTLAHAYAKGRVDNAQLAIFKQGSLLAYTDTLLQLDPTIRLIHIHRDPRAVTASALNTERPYFRGEGFGRRDPVFIGRVWRTHTAVALDHVRNGLMHSIGYAQLLLQPEPELRALAEWLGQSLQNAPGAGGLAVAAAERDAHRLVAAAPDKTRIDAWQQSLSRRAGYSIEYVTAPTLTEAGYAPWYSPHMTSMQKWRDRVSATGIHQLASLKFVARRLRDLGRQPAETVGRLRARLRRGPMA